MELIRKTWENDHEYMSIIEDLIDHPDLLKLNNITHHYYSTRLLYSFFVSYMSYKLAKNLQLDYISTARAALLHDFFLEEREDIKELGIGSHNAVHPKIALENAKRITKINKLEEDIILKHMFLCTPRGGIPRYRESFIVTLIDKYCAIFEVSKPTRLWFSNLYKILQTKVSYS